jgi:Xaa-Pro aminopeptidase
MMKIMVCRVFAWILALGVSYAAAPAIEKNEYAERRAKLRKATPDAAILLFAAQPPPDIHDRNGFFQETNFYYLTGWNEPHAALLLCSACGPDLEEALFLPKRNERREKYEGRRLAPGDADATAKSGFQHVFSTAQLEATLGRALAEATGFYTLFDGHEEALRKLAPLRNLADIRSRITALRMIKSPAEQALLMDSIHATLDAHRASWKATKPGLYEYEVSSAMQDTYYRRGCERNAYPPIVGSGPNSVILHYAANKRRMDAGDLLLMDVGAECSMYAADITRTIPVNGKFTARQREIYDLVLKAQEAAIAQAKPGIKLADLTRFAQEYLDKQGKGPGGKPWRDYMIHPISHHIGLDVHDPFDANALMAEGMVVTVEPGLYLAEESLGVRIEDMIVFTKDGAKVMSAALAKTAAEIEKEMKR